MLYKVKKNLKPLKLQFKKFRYIYIQTTISKWLFCYTFIAYVKKSILNTWFMYIDI